MKRCAKEGCCIKIERIGKMKNVCAGTLHKGPGVTRCIVRHPCNPSQAMENCQESNSCLLKRRRKRKNTYTRSRIQEELIGVVEELEAIISFNESNRYNWVNFLYLSFKKTTFTRKFCYLVFSLHVVGDTASPRQEVRAYL